MRGHRLKSHRGPAKELRRITMPPGSATYPRHRPYTRYAGVSYYERRNRAAQPAIPQLGGLPLAMEQAALYTQATGDRFIAYLASFRKRHADYWLAESC